MKKRHSMKKKVHLINDAITLIPLLHKKKEKYTWRCLLEMRVGIQLVFLLLFILLNQVSVDLEVLDVEVRMEKSDLLFA